MVGVELDGRVIISIDCSLVWLSHPGPGLLYDDVSSLGEVRVRETAGVVPRVRLQATGDGED